MNTNIVGKILLGEFSIPVYSSLDEPLFRASDLTSLVEYSEGNTWNMLKLCEDDEKLVLPVVVSGQRRKVSFVTEAGLYNILAQSKMPLARKWRKVVHEELIRLRKEAGRTIEEQFEEWNSLIDDIYYDEETGMLMKSVTVPGGDIEQVPLDKF